MSTKKPHRYEIIDKQYPVRIRVHVAGTYRDWENEETNRWLRRLAGEGNYGVTPGRVWSGTRGALIHLPSLYVAQQLILACPHVRLLGERYDGPYR